MTIDQILQQEIKDSDVWLSREKDESTYKRDLKKRIELINWVLENMKNPNVEICSLLESRMNEITLAINQTYSIFESDKLHSELRILVGYFIGFVATSYLKYFHQELPVMTIFLQNCSHHGGRTECFGGGSRCIIRIYAPLAGDKQEDFFVHTGMTAEEREDIHDDTLAKLTDDVNELIREAEKKRPNKHIGIMITPLGLFFRYNSKTPPSEEWFKKATEITDENVEQILKLTTK